MFNLEAWPDARAHFQAACRNCNCVDPLFHRDFDAAQN